ncbi:flavodoxin domain-containing protein [Lachnospiraceae bacterium ZAX-1]
MAKLGKNEYSTRNFFHLRGGLDYEKLGFIHRNLMKMLNKAVAKKTDSEMNEVEKVIKEIYGKQVDFTNKATIKPIVAYINNSKKL